MYEWSLEQRRKDDTPTFENRAIHSVKNSPKFIDLFIYQFHRYDIFFLLWYHMTVKGIKCQINFSQITWKFCFVFSEISYMYMYLWISLFFPRISFFFEEIQMPYQFYLFILFAQEINLHIILQQLTVMRRSRDAWVIGWSRLTYGKF